MSAMAAARSHGTGRRMDAPEVLFLGGLVGGILSWTLAALVCLVADPGALPAVLVSGAVVLAWCSAGQLVDALALRLASAGGLLLTLMSFVVRALALGLLLVWFGTVPQVQAALPAQWLAVGALAVAVGWPAGLLTLHSRQRHPVYDAEYHAPPTWEDQT